MLLGTVVAGRFEVETLAGQGGMGTVYRARDRSDGSAVALKVLKEGSHADAERFAREAKALSELQHPGIVRYVSHGVTPEGQAFLAMEWLEGEDLNQRLARGPLEVAECIALGRRVGDALSVAHSRGIVHRDVKPSNLLLPGGRVEDVKVVDFGVARLLGWGSGPRTRPGIVVGTPGYMAPEQARGDEEIDARADVFALGCVLYECLTGQVAFPGEHVMAVLAKILFREVPSVRDVRAEVPDALDALVLAMMHKKADLRPAGGAEVAAAFGRLDALQGVPSSGAEGPAARVITGGALRLVSLVLAEGVPSRDPAAGSTGDAPTSTDLGAALVAHGGVAQPLATGGLVITFTGEGTATDLAQQAARCALGIAALAEGARIAVATGLGDVTGQGVVGEAIDRGVRLLHEPRDARGSSILLDEVTASLLGPRFQRNAGGVLSSEQPIEEASHLLLGRPTPCVGRKRELGQLVGIFESCVDEPESRAVVVTGAPGAGKSRLREELSRSVAERWPHALVLLGCGERTRRGARLAILADAVRRQLGLRERDPLVLQRKVLAARVASRFPGEDRAAVIEFLGELVGVPFPDETSVRLRAARADAQLMSDQLERAWLDLLGAECDRHPVLLVLEDLQWADGPTLRFVDVALRTLHDRPLCVLALARPELDAIEPNLWAARRVDRVALQSLGARACAELVHAVLGDEVPSAEVTRIVERAGGNALFLEELIRARAEGSGDAPPASVLAMLQARLDALGVEPKRVLRAASIFGRTFWREGVRVLLGELAPEPALGRWLAELGERGFVARPRTEQTPGQEEWVFRHDLQRDAAYASLPDEERVLGHRLAAEWLERGGARGSLAIAEHFELGGQRARAVAGYAEAAEAALQANDLQAARAHAERAVACGASGEILGAVRALETEISRWQGENARGVTEGREAVRLLPRGATPWYLAAGQLASLLGRTGAHEALVALGRELLEPPPPEASGAWVVAAARAAISLLFAGQYALGDELLGAIESFAAGTAQPEATVVAWFHLARATRAQFEGDVSALAAEEEAAARAYESVGNQRCAWEERTHAGFAYVLLGAYDRAQDILREAVRQGEQLGLPLVRTNALHNLGLALALGGQLDEGLAAEREAIRLYTGSGYRRALGACRLYAARILLLRGELGEALGEAQMAAAALAGSAPALAMAHAVLARIHQARGANLEALEQAGKAHEILVGLGTLEEGDAFVRLTYAETLRASGDEDAGLRVLQEARRHVLETAAKIGDPELREGFLRRVQENARILAATDPAR